MAGLPGSGLLEHATDRAAAAAANAWDGTLGPGLADLRPMPSTVIDEGPQRSVRRYLNDESLPPTGEPVLLVPPLAAPASCFDLRRGCSLAEHLLAAGHRTYLLDYGAISFGDRDLGLEHWITDVLPPAIEAVAADAGEEVALLGWCLGGIFSLLTVAEDPALPVDALCLVASPFDFTQVRLAAAIRPLANLTGGALGTALYRLMGGVPTPLVRTGFQLASLDKYLTRPWAVATHLHDREFLAQMEAVDAFTSNMHAYPGRTFGQLYHRFFRVNDLAAGRLELADHTIDVRDLEQPVLVVAGDSDPLAPRAAVHTWPSSSPTSATSCCVPRRAGISACSPAARRARRHGASSTSSSPPSAGTPSPSDRQPEEGGRAGRRGERARGRRRPTRGLRRAASAPPARSPRARRAARSR